MKRIVATVLATATTFVSVSALAPSVSSGETKSVNRPAGSIEWARCSDQPKFECARLAVPMSATDARLGNVSLSLLRVKASKSKRRLGVLLVNPGGPGASGRIFATQLARNPVFKRIRERYDVIGWDPRGVGESTPIRCLGPTGYDRFFAADPSPDSERERQDLIAVSKEFASGCVSRNGDILSHVSTADSVADMDRIRVALGENTISFLGFSYGTYLGAYYADAFPKRVGRFVLDGALDPLADADDRVEQQALGFETALRGFANSCRKACTFVRKGETPIVAFERLMAGIERTPLRVQWRGPEDDKTKEANENVRVRTLGAGEASVGVLAALYNVNVGWPRLRAALNDVERGEGAALLSLFDLYADRGPEGVYRNTSDANAATNCTDLPAFDEAHYDALAKRLQKVAPHFGAFAAYSTLLCAYWPSQGSAPRAVSARGAAPILVIGTTRDPATPYVWAQSLSRQLVSSTLLTYDGDGHTAILTGNGCVRKAMESYLLDGMSPKRNTTCR